MPTRGMVHNVFGELYVVMQALPPEGKGCIYLMGPEALRGWVGRCLCASAPVVERSSDR